MTAAVDLPALARSQGAGRRRSTRKRERRIRAVRPAMGVARRTHAAIRRMMAPIVEEVQRVIPEILRRTESEWLVKDAVDDELGRAFEELKRRHRVTTEAVSEAIAEDLVQGANAAHRSRFYRAVQQSVGVDLAGIVSEGGLEPVLRMKSRESANLITTIPSEYLSKVQTLVYESVIQGRTSAKSMIEELQDLAEITDRRARFIARDQTAKLTSAIARERATALGVEEYIWRTSKDERVRESHRKKNGKRFRYDDPPADTGAPGEDFQCRCTAEPVISL